MPIFYRAAPLMPSETGMGFITPLASSAIPLIEGRMRNAASVSSHVAVTGRKTEGLMHWRQALRKEPDNVPVLNETAWVLSTSADAGVRNGSEAVSLAEHAVELTLAREPAILGTLAAAYAETGRFDKAIELEQRAADLATRQGNAPLAATLGARLTQLQEKTPIRQR